MVEKKKQNQPKKHAAKTKAICKARRRKIIKALSEGKTLKAAGVAGGLSEKTAPAQVSEILKEPETQASFKALLDKVIPDTVQASKYLECLAATKVISAMVIAGDGEGMKDANSMTRDFVEVPDYATQLKTNDSISKLKGHLVEKHEMDVSGALMTLVAKQLSGGNGASNHTGVVKKS